MAEIGVGVEPWRARTMKTGGYLATVVALIAIWFLVTRLGWISSQILPAPGDVLGSVGPLASSGELQSSLGTTLFRILMSFLLGVVLGVPLGGFAWRFPDAGQAMRPYLAASYSVPLVVFYPFFLVVFGINDWPVIALTTVMTTVPVCLNTYVGLQAAPKVLVDVGRSLERTPGQIFRQILLPSAWPHTLAGIKLSMVYAVVGVIALEFIAAQAGLGNRIQYYYETFDPDSMYVFIILTLLLAGFCVALVVVIEALTTHGRGTFVMTGHSGAVASRADAPTTGGAGIRAGLRAIVIPALALIVWYILSRLVFVVVSPPVAIRTLIRDLGNVQYLGDLGDTLMKIAIAFAVSAILGTVIGITVGLVRPAREIFEPLILILNGVPKIVLYPILLVIFGLGGISQIIMGIIFGTLPVLVNVMSGLATMRPVYRKVARMLEVGPMRALFRVYLPAVMPMLIVALQLGFSLSVLGVLYSELIASRNGLGQRIIETYSAGIYDRMTASVLVVLFIALSGAWLLHLVERSVMRHH